MKFPAGTWSLAIRRKILFSLLLTFGIISVTSTYLRLSETDDELFHVKCGMEWLSDGTYTIQSLHPPLGRVAGAFFPYLLKVDDQNRRATKHESWRDTYLYRLWTTRLGILPFYIGSCILVFLWSRELFGSTSALWSLALYVSTSTVTAHGALATTDMVYTLMLLWAIYQGIRWQEQPSWTNSLLLGESLGLMIGSKFSGLVQWPITMLLIVLAQCIADFIRYKKISSPIQLMHIKTGLLAVIPLMAFTLSAIYRFSLDPLWDGIKSAYDLNEHGFSVWLYEPLHHRSVWYFFPVVFFFKTPLSLFAATFFGNKAILQNIKTNTMVRQIFPLLSAIGIMAISTTSHINLGVRHVLILYPLLAIPAGYGLALLWQKSWWGQGVASGLMLWQIFGFISAAPEHIAYFNELAGKHPEHITLDSDYDWGQSMILLNETLESRGVDSVYLCVRKDAVWSAHTLLYAKILPCPHEPVTGWVAVGRAYQLLYGNNFAWLNGREALQTIGRTMDLYYIPPQ